MLRKVLQNIAESEDIELNITISKVLYGDFFRQVNFLHKIYVI